ncbi:MAG: riboflavin synthase [Kiritimatiellae bacterium]|nr:riboflavin synthase [Kiritimatiellia bacterium]
MFTGLIQQTGSLAKLTREGGGWRLRVAHAPWPEPLSSGESVAVQGACLTVVAADLRWFDADLLDETLARTALSRLPQGARLNLERALRLGDRLGGHIVSGHVDETGQLRRIEPRGRDVALTVACSKRLARLTILKGSVALDGVSLTVTDLQETSLTVEIIPHTWTHTSLSERRESDYVNLEADILGKHVARLLGRDEEAGAAGAHLDLDLLERSGFTA